MNYIGFDKNGNKLQLGDICKFKIKNSDIGYYEGIITYAEDYYCYSFEMEDDSFPAINMYNCLDIEKIINIYSTKPGDKYEFYRKIFK